MNSLVLASLSLPNLVSRLPGGVAQGIIWGIMALGVYITFRLLDVADLTVDGSFTTGGAVTVMLIIAGWPAWAALLAAVVAGLLAGLVTGLLHTKLGIPAILAGILTQFALYSINLRIMSMKANTPVNPDKYSLFLTLRSVPGAIWKGLLLAAVLIALLYWYFGTEQGSAIRATGANPAMSRAQGININAMKVLGLSLSNGTDETCSDAQIAEIERCACPGCGSCSGMFTANSMNCLTEALGLSLPGNGTIVATHVNRRRLFEDAAALIVRNAERYYFEGDERVLPRSIATKAAFENAMSLDIAMGGSTNTVLHLLAVAHEAGVDFTMQDIDRLSRRVPVLCKVAPNSHYHIQDVNRAGGIFAILGELDRAGLLDTSVLRVDGRTLGEAIPACDILNPAAADAARRRALSAPAGHYSRELGAQHSYYEEPDTDRTAGCIRDVDGLYFLLYEFYLG